MNFILLLALKEEEYFVIDVVKLNINAAWGIGIGIKNEPTRTTAKHKPQPTIRKAL